MSLAQALLSELCSNCVSAAGRAVLKRCEFSLRACFVRPKRQVGVSPRGYRTFLMVLGSQEGDVKGNDPALSSCGFL